MPDPKIEPKPAATANGWYYLVKLFSLLILSITLFPPYFSNNYAIYWKRFQ